jgi:hypothetical protein
VAVPEQPRRLTELWNQSFDDLGHWKNDSLTFSFPSVWEFAVDAYRRPLPLDFSGPEQLVLDAGIEFGRQREVAPGKTWAREPKQ